MTFPVKAAAVIILSILAVLSQSAFASNSKEEIFLKQFFTPPDYTDGVAEATGREPHGSAFTDLDGDGDPEIVLVWTTLGSTYWHTDLTIFSAKSGDYVAVGTLQLNGEATLAEVKDGVILVDQTEYAKGDPLCCPTIKKREHYKFASGEIVKLDSNPPNHR